MSEKDEMLQRAERMLEKVRNDTEAYQGKCRDCRFVHQTLISESGDYCTNPVIQAASMLMDQGSPRDESTRCNNQRKHGTKDLYIYGYEIFCGPNGLLFEPKHVPGPAGITVGDHLWLRIKSWFR